ncbi:hypothetical protein ACH3VS_20880 [Streptomyces sp. WSLK1-3]|uniref:hypothetical protein n=1 Tax=Streptomyces sp. WSLK1-3 TaxID=3375475 RepID=UPI00378FE2DE
MSERASYGNQHGGECIPHPGPRSCTARSDRTITSTGTGIPCSGAAGGPSTGGDAAVSDYVIDGDLQVEAHVLDLDERQVGVLGRAAPLEVLPPKQQRISREVEPGAHDSAPSRHA